MPQIPSTRWCPTPEQLMILEELYRNGIRTPNASQIQQITAHLSLYGKIEDKNVFYWFQNHKARERQKLRRRLGRQHQVLHQSAEGSSTHPTPPLLHLAPPNFLDQETHITSQGMGLVGELEATAGDQISQEEQEAALTAASEAEYGQAWMVATMMEDGLPHDQYYCRPSLKTLDLFPTKTTGRGSIKDECSNSNSKSSGSTSTN